MIGPIILILTDLSCYTSIPASCSHLSTRGFISMRYQIYFRITHCVCPNAFYSSKSNKPHSNPISRKPHKFQSFIDETVPNTHLTYIYFCLEPMHSSNNNYYISTIVSKGKHSNITHVIYGYTSCQGSNILCVI